MEALQLLSRSEMKMIKGGCGIMYSDGTWECGWSEDDAKSWYENGPDIDAYCCASCGEEGFLGAAECRGGSNLEVN